MKVTPLAILILLAQTASAQAPAQISLSVPKVSVMTGEPVVVVVRLTGNLSTAVDPELVWADAPLKILVNSGSGARQHLEKAWLSGWRASNNRPLPPQGLTIEYVLSYDASREDWPFAAPGTYQLQAAYQTDSVSLLSSPVSLTVSAPSPSEMPVHDALRLAGPRILGVHQADLLGGIAAEIVTRYPGSVYVQELILNDLQYRLGDVLNGFDPDVPERSDDLSPAKPDVRPETIRRRAESLLPAAEACAGVGSAVQADAVLFLAGLQGLLGQAEASQRTYRRVVAEFPGRRVVELALEEMDDQTEPTLEVRAIGTLWPPNKKLVVITMAVTAGDDSGTAPTITLVSITCDDACDPAQDIAEAAFGTDDRAFKLRADRKGGGSGRTYTITYEATDTAGNKATATTTVVVPHDQGKK